MAYLTSSTLNYTGLVTTTGNTPTTINTISAAMAGAYSFQVRAIAWDNANDATAYVNIAALVMSNGTSAVVVGTPVNIFTTISSGTLTTVDLNVTTSGTNILIQVIGEVGTTINWKSLVTLVPAF